MLGAGEPRPPGHVISPHVRKGSQHPGRLSSDDYDLDSVVATYWDTVLQWIRSTGKVRGGEAEEVRQDVFVRVIREIRAGNRYPVPIRAAIYQITNWTIMGFVAGAAGHHEREQPIGDGPVHEPADDGALREIDGIGEDEVVEQLLARLGDREGTLMTMLYLEGLTLPEVAQAMDITGNNAHQIHFRAKQRIHEWLVEGGA